MTSHQSHQQKKKQRSNIVTHRKNHQWNLFSFILYGIYSAIAIWCCCYPYSIHIGDCCRRALRTTSSYVTLFFCIHKLARIEWEDVPIGEQCNNNKNVGNDKQTTRTVFVGRSGDHQNVFPSSFRCHKTKKRICKHRWVLHTLYSLFRVHCSQSKRVLFSSWSKLNSYLTVRPLQPLSWLILIPFRASVRQAHSTTHAWACVLLQSVD